MVNLLPSATSWFTQQNWEPFPFQVEAWQAYLEGKHGLVNAPTGSGKTYSLGMPPLLEFIQNHPDYKNLGQEKRGVQLIWITPIRALSKEIFAALTRLVEGMEVPWRIGVRTGDTTSAERQKQKRNMPEILITTPESMHILMASKGYRKLFANLKAIVVDEWHELMGSKRAVQMELALSCLKSISPNLRIWGISATIGNMEEAQAVLFGQDIPEEKIQLVKADIQKEIEVISILPDEIERFPWSGHLGITLLEKVLPIIDQSESTLIFTNTRAQAEMWYQQILAAAPELAGIIAMHHSSISRELRDWVEDALHEGKLKAVVCTSSLDLGVDFRPVETIIQVGGPKGVSRFMQRAGRSGHRPGAKSRIYFLPTHSLELIEAAALRTAIDEQLLEHRTPYIRSFDVLIQYLMTLAVSDGFKPDELFVQLKQTFSYESISEEEWEWVLDFIHSGGKTLYAYDEYKKIEIEEDGLWKVNDRRIATRHRLSIGTIVSDAVLWVKYMRGGRIGTIEEWFVSSLKKGDVFIFAGRNLEFVAIESGNVLVKKSKKKEGKVPAWMGGRLPLSSQMSQMLRRKLTEALNGTSKDEEIRTIAPLLDLQLSRSHIPRADELLIECFQSREGHHVVMYPFEGRFVHEGIASLLAYRISLLQPISFTLAYNDYGLELLSNQEIPIHMALDNNIFTTDHLMDDILASLNATEMARRKFRDIGSISGLVFRGYPGKHIKNKHLQSTSQQFFAVFKEYEPDNLLFRQAFQEVLEFQLEETRLRQALERINDQEIKLYFPETATPFSFPIMVDRLREQLSSERLKDRVKRMTLALERG